MGELLTSLAQGAAKLDHNIRSFVSEHDKGTLGRAARTKWFDETPMDERNEGTTNAIEPKTGGAMGRRDFLKIAGTIAGGAVAIKTAEFLSACGLKPEAPPTVPPSPSATPGFVEQGIQYNDVSVLDEAATLAEAKKAGIPLEDSYAAFINILQDKKQYPQLETNGATYDRFSIVVPNVSGMKTERFSYNFLGMRTKDGSHSYAFMFVPWLADDGKAVRGFKVVSLDPTELDVRGIKRGALAVFKDPMTEQTIEPKPVFIFPTNIADWRKMSPEQRAAESVQFIPYNLNATKDIKVSGGKLARLVIMDPAIATATPEPKVTSTPEPTKVVEAAPANCLNLADAQKVAKARLDQLSKERGKPVTLEDLLREQEAKYGKTKVEMIADLGEWYAFRAKITNPLILGSYEMKTDVGAGTCVVIGYPTASGKVEIISSLIAVTVGNEWGRIPVLGGSISDDDMQKNFIQKSGFARWLEEAKDKGSIAVIGIDLALSEKARSTRFDGTPFFRRDLVKRFISQSWYSAFLSDKNNWPPNLNPGAPDLIELVKFLWQQIKDGKTKNEPGLIIDVITVR